MTSLEHRSPPLEESKNKRTTYNDSLEKMNHEFSAGLRAMDKDSELKLLSLRSPELIRSQENLELLAKENAELK